jgi:hypothetical protein
MHSKEYHSLLSWPEFTVCEDLCAFIIISP